MKTKVIDAVVGTIIVLMAALAIAAFTMARKPPAIIATVSGGKPQIKLSEARPVVRKYVEELSNDAEWSGLGKLSEEGKAKEVESIISGMKAQGTYDFVD